MLKLVQILFNLISEGMFIFISSCIRHEQVDLNKGEHNSFSNQL